MTNRVQKQRQGRIRPSPARVAAVILVVLSLWLLWLGRPFDAHSDQRLFLPAGETSRTLPAADPAALRVRVATINWEALSPDTKQVRLNLFEDVTLTAVRQRVDRSVIDGYVWVGAIVGRPEGHVALSVRGDILAGTVSLNGVERYTVRYAGQARENGAAGAIDTPVHLIREINPSSYYTPTRPDYLFPEPPRDWNALQDETVACEDGSVVDLMAAYTTAARMGEGGQDAIEGLLNLRISEMNTANDNSLVEFRWRLVHAMEVDYQESGDIDFDLERLATPDDGYLDEVQQARNLYKADLAGLIIAQGSGGTCGLAYQMNPLGDWFEGWAYGVTALDYEDPYDCHPLTLAHEFGHNLGNGHDRANAYGEPLFPYAYGYQSPAQTFRTIMSYNCPEGCPRINHWANPDVLFQGEPTGVDYETDPEHAADIARTMRESVGVVANFRPNCPASPTETATPTETTTPTGTATITATATPLVPSPTATGAPADTITPTPTATATPSPTATSPGPTPTATRSPKKTPTATASPSLTPMLPTATPTIRPGLRHHSFLGVVLGR